MERDEIVMFLLWKLGTRTFKLVVWLCLVVVCATSSYVIYAREELELITQFQALRLVDPLPKARELAREERYCEALQHLDYFLEYEYVKNDARVRAFYEELRNKREDLAFRAKDVWSGVWRGKGACMESLVSATVSDFLIVGDIRDLTWFGLDRFSGREADTFTAALAGMGVLLTTATYLGTAATAGAGASGGVPARSALSLLKLAKRTNKIPPSLQKSLGRVFDRCRHTVSLKPFRPAADSIYRISKVDGLTIPDFLTILSRTGKVSDLKFMERVATTYGKNTGKFLKLGGDAPLDVLRRFGKSKDLTRAVDTSIQYGSDGTRLLKRTGPSKFLRYLTIAKYSTRAARSAWNNRLTLFLAGIAGLFPTWVLGFAALASGTGAFGIPAYRVYRRLRARNR